MATKRQSRKAGGEGGSSPLRNPARHGYAPTRRPPPHNAEWEATFDAVADAVWLLDPKHRILRCNKAAAALCGKAPAEMLGRRCCEVVHGTARPIKGCPVARMKRSRQRESMELRSAGQIYQVTVDPLLGRSGTLEGAVHIIRNITEQKQAEASLRQLNETLEQRVAERTARVRESETQLRAMFETASIGIAQADPVTGQWLRVNRKMCAITGYSADELLTMRVPEITHPDDRARDWDAFQRVVRGRAPHYRMEKRYVRKDGTLAWVNVNMTIIRDTAGRPARTMATIEDITERKRMEAALRESEKQFRSLHENAVVGFYRTTPDGRILMANPALLKMLGVASLKELARRSRQKSGFGPDYSRKAFQARLEREGQIIGLEARWTRRDGSTLFVRENSRALRDDAGRIVFYDGSVEDITERKELERQILEISEREQQRIGQDLHDGLSQQLTGIVFLNATLFEKLTGQTRAEADETRRIGDLLGQAQADLRHVARGLQPVAPIPDGLMVALTELTESVAVRCRVACQFKCPRPVLINDNTVSTHLFRITQEAVNNALRHGQPRSITVGLKRSGGKLILQIQDDGRGLPPAGGQTNGLGLRIMRTRCEAMRGRIDVRSAHPHGTIVHCIVPLTTG